MDNNKISEKKVFTILAIDLFSMTGIILPAVVARSLGKNGFTGLLLASGLALVAACYFLWVTKNGEIPYNRVILEMPSGIQWIISGIYVIRYFIHGLFLMGIMSALIKEVLLPDQKVGWILAPFLLLTFLAAGKDLSVRGNILEVLFPYIFLPLFVVVLLALFEVDYKSLPEQIFGGKMTETNWSAVLPVFLFYQPIEFLLFLAPCRKPEKRKRGYAVTGACLFVILVNLLIYVAAVGMFGTVRTGEKLWSALYIMQSVRLPGHFVERLDILFLIFYIFSTFALFSGYLFYSESLILTGKKPWHKKIYPAIYLAGIFFLTIKNSDVEQFFAFFMNYKMWIDLPLAILAPLLVRLLANGRRKSAKKMAAMLLCAGVMVVMGGCQNKVDIEDRNYVMTFGAEMGEGDNYRITYETAQLSKESSDGSGKKQGQSVSFSGDSIKDVEKKEKKTDDKRLDYGHLKAILIQEKLAEKKDMWKSFVKELEQKRGIAGTTLVFLVEEKPEEYMKLTEEWGTSLGEYLERMMSNHEENEEKEYTLSELLRDEAEGNQNRKVPVLSIQDDKIQIRETNWENEQTPISQQVLRFHIRANSDSEEDQHIKTKVKNRILPYLQQLFSDCDSKESCMAVAAKSLDLIQDEVEKACVLEGTEKKAAVYLCQESFPLKQYGNMVFPSGIYDALRIDLGEGMGANWWCMMYPSLCMVDGVVEGVAPEDQKELEETLEEEDYESLFASPKENNIGVKWRIFEIIQGFFGEMRP